MLISLVLATIGRTEELVRCIESLSAQTENSFEVLIVDQNTDNRLVPIIAAAKSTGMAIRHLRVASQGLSNARNVGIRAAAGEFVGFPDDDCWYEPDTIAQIVSAVSRKPTIDGVIANWVEQSHGLTLRLNDEPLSHAAWRKFRGGQASSITLFLRRTLLDDIGGFDCRFGLGQWFGAGEETDLILTLLDRDALIVRLPAARVHHSFGQQLPARLADRCTAVRRRARGTGALYAKHRLGIYTVLRGLVSPIINPLIRLRGFSLLATGAATSLGRIEGLTRWGWGRK